MSVSSRRTYDTDSIVLRRIFAYDISNSPFSTGFVLTSVTKGLATFLSPNVALSTIGVSNLPAQLSSIEGALYSTFGVFTSNLPSSPAVFLASTVQGLGTAGYVSTSYVTSTIRGLGSLGYVSTSALAPYFTSTVTGLGTSGYISTATLNSTLTGTFISTVGGLGQIYTSTAATFADSLISTVKGLGTSQYISTSQLQSTVQGIGSSGYISTSQLQSTVQGIGSSGYLSTSQLVSSIQGLGSSQYVSTSQLVSSIQGLATSGYVSSSQLFSSVQGVITSLSSIASATNIRSTYTNTYAGNWCNVNFLYSNLGPFSTVQSFQVDLGQALRNQMGVSTTNLDIEFKANLQFGYYDSRSIQYDFSTCLVKGVSLNTTSILAQENISFYILNASAVNLPFFFTEKYRFVLNDLSTISTLKSDTSFSTLSVFHRIGISSPTTNQLFIAPAQPTSIIVVVDNSTRTTP